VAARPRPGRVAFQTRFGSPPAEWSAAPHAVSGAGLLLLDGRELDEWKEEGLSNGFDIARPPRTMIGSAAERGIWLLPVDGPQPPLSLGMSFKELKGLARRLGLRSALNLDRGGSHTLVPRGDWVGE